MTTSRIKIVACLLMIIGCGRLTVSTILDSTGQGDPVFLFQFQLGLAYVPLVMAIAVAHSMSAASWVFAFVFEQIAATFITCYLIPRRIPDDLAWLPFSAVAHFLAAGALVAGVMWYQRNKHVHQAA